MLTAKKKAARPSNPSKPREATTLLRADHKVVSGLFAEYEGTRSTAKRKQLVSQICTELTVHAQVEEEIFYPAVQLALKDHDLVPEACTLKAFIAEVEGAEPDEDISDAKIKVLSEYVTHQVKEEQNEMFPKAKTTLDMVELGDRLSERKKALLVARK